ncbi:chemotaxis protein CheW [Janthinobacterium sp. HH01]|uniref:chemotaxis protein CheW n=1 Tax=Janthinobacterium sp. HH01 TaxID=1198452 RepID=UPI0002AEABFF|nr:chemotaxis protein CheW [Janthinobacterium sp. HH01]ELX08817.1 chemotaxis protein CheW [Janthinobacterium sp. HH01]
MERTTDSPATAGQEPRRTLVFGLGAEDYAIDIGLVQELRGYGAVTRLANAPVCLKGVINLRGVIVPLVDLRIKFGQPAPGYDASTVVIVLNLGRRTVGVVVDRVDEVVGLEPEQLQPPPQLGEAGVTDHVLGVATVDQRMLILVDMARLLAEFNPDRATALPLAA